MVDFLQVELGHSWQQEELRAPVWEWRGPGLLWATPRGLEPQEGCERAWTGGRVRGWGVEIVLVEFGLGRQ